MTDIESRTIYGLIKETLEALIQIRDTVSPGRPLSRRTYLEFMDVIRKPIAKLQNCLLGCPSGIHSGSSCHCKQDGTPKHVTGRGYY